MTLTLVPMPPSPLPVSRGPLTLVDPTEGLG